MHQTFRCLPLSCCVFYPKKQVMKAYFIVQMLIFPKESLGISKLLPYLISLIIINETVEGALISNLTVLQSQWQNEFMMHCHLSMWISVTV